LPYCLMRTLSFPPASVLDPTLLTFLTEFKMLIPDGATLQPFQAVVKSPHLGSSISVNGKKNTKKCVFLGINLTREKVTAVTKP
jgi:hypothetical protein